MITLPANIDVVTWLLAVEYQDGNAVKTIRYTDGDASVNLTGKTPAVFDGLYVPGDWLVSENPLTFPSRLEKQQWVVTLGDHDFAHKRRFASGWRKKAVRLAWVTEPGDAFMAWRDGLIVGRQFLTDEALGRTTRLMVGSPLRDPVGSTKKRFMTGEFQREAAKDSKGDPNFVDDSLDHAQRKVSENWGGS